MAVMQISIGDNDITEQKKEETQQQQSLPKEEPKTINTMNTSNSSSNVNKFSFQPQPQQQPPSSTMMPQTKSVSGKNVSNLFGTTKK